MENEGAESSGSEVSEGAVFEDGKDARVVKVTMQCLLELFMSLYFLFL